LNAVCDWLIAHDLVATAIAVGLLAVGVYALIRFIERED